jgi:Rrf2 family protein
VSTATKDVPAGSGRLDFPLRISARADYAVRAAAHLAGASRDQLVKGEEIARGQGIPPKFLVQILANLRRARLVLSHRGIEGGYRLARPAEDISVADVVRAVEGSLTSVQGVPPADTVYPDDGEVVRQVWIAVEATVDSLLENVTLADLALGVLPARVASLLESSTTA